MTQIEFVTELEQALRGNVEERIIQENVRYYNDYISEQRAAGKSEEEIFASLGSPRLIAKTIIDTSGEASTQGNSHAGSYNYSTGSDDSSTGGDGWSFSWMKETASQNWVTKTIAILAIVAVVFYIFLNRTAIGKHIYAIGGNAEAAKLSGINIDKTIIIVYTICGFMAALGGIVQMGRVDSAFPLAGTGYELNAVASVVIGGASMKGGSGTVSGTIIGAMVIAVLNNGLNLLHVSTYAQQIALGIVIIGAVYVDVLRERLGSKAKKN